jgi:hypothetical protein
MPTPIQTLLTGLIDYAGLFPPATLGMAEAVREYAGHLASPDRWMLGRFVVPSARLDEFSSAAGPILPREDALAWRMVVLPSPDIAGSVQAMGEFNCRHAAAGQGRTVIDTIEFKATSAGDVTADLERMPPWLTAYVEVPLDDRMGAILDAVKASGARAKVRTGGVTPDAFPASESLARFIRATVERRLPFKATAGLHHPLRGAYRLTYDADPPQGTMFGFLNVFLAAALARQGGSHDGVVALLEERDPGALIAGGDGITWRGHHFGASALRELREHAAVSFGSCSFREPTDELRTLAWL